MRIAALLVALFVVVVGIVGIVSPDSLTKVRRQYFATPEFQPAAASRLESLTVGARAGVASWTNFSRSRTQSLDQLTAYGCS
jgi:hypothetical protein